MKFWFLLSLNEIGLNKSGLVRFLLLLNEIRAILDTKYLLKWKQILIIHLFLAEHLRDWRQRYFILKDNGEFIGKKKFMENIQTIFLWNWFSIFDFQQVFGLYFLNFLVFSAEKLPVPDRVLTWIWFFFCALQDTGRNQVQKQS